ncbi:GMP/IMP nucleotidase [Salinibius halmophilus]|uniref:GMP/IMP nucleotidase n=1 Tax=Salinibius halmophilus TaxID=1853216 RepID=UPI000E671B5D|nr:GMP/IMP nucleotidase [Salinibius halmophilus]
MLNWQQIDTVMLDMDGTLLDLHFDEHFWTKDIVHAYSQQHGVSNEEAQAFLDPWFSQTHGTLDWYCTDFWSRLAGLSVARLKRQCSHRIAWRPGAREFVYWLKSQNKQVWLTTNAHRDGFMVKAEVTELDALMDKIIISHELNAPKEHDIFWQYLQQQHPFDKTRTLFVDDNETVLDAANSYGVKHLLTISQPNMHQPARESVRYPVTNDFYELYPCKQ